MQAFITMINIIIAKEIMFNILIKCFKKFQSIITMDSIDINNEINSNIIKLEKRRGLKILKNPKIMKN